MEAKDTVMKHEQLDNIPKIKSQPYSIDIYGLEAVAKTQAEISFKIGKTAGVAESLLPALKAIEESRKAGMGEVVRWIEKHEMHLNHNYRDWKAFKKERGL